MLKQRILVAIGAAATLLEVCSVQASFYSEMWWPQLLEAAALTAWEITPVLYQTLQTTKKPLGRVFDDSNTIIWHWPKRTIVKLCATQTFQVFQIQDNHNHSLLINDPELSDTSCCYMLTSPEGAGQASVYFNLNNLDWQRSAYWGGKWLPLAGFIEYGGGQSRLMCCFQPSESSPRKCGTTEHTERSDLSSSVNDSGGASGGGDSPPPNKDIFDEGNENEIDQLISQLVVIINNPYLFNKLIILLEAYQSRMDQVYLVDAFSYMGLPLGSWRQALLPNGCLNKETLTVFIKKLGEKNRFSLTYALRVIDDPVPTVISPNSKLNDTGQETPATPAERDYGEINIPQIVQQLFIIISKPYWLNKLIILIEAGEDQLDQANMANAFMSQNLPIGDWRQIFSLSNIQYLFVFVQELKERNQAFLMYAIKAIDPPAQTVKPPMDSTGQ